MKLRLEQQSKPFHTEACTAVAWSRTNELYSCSDDHTIMKWTVSGEPAAKVFDLDGCGVTTIRWFPQQSRVKAKTENFAVACTDGSFRFISASTGRLERQPIQAHQGACTTLEWSYDGGAIATGGEDGIVKIWSPSGMPRQTLYNTGKTIYTLAWSIDGTEVCLSMEKDLIVKPLVAGSKHLQWRAHEGIVLQVDWSPVQNLIVSCGEDCKYKVWDSFGRCLYSSPPANKPFTSVRFSPDGEMFGVGGHGEVRLCDKMGWTLSRELCGREIATSTDAPVEGEEPTASVEAIQNGSVLDLAWNYDNSQLAAATADGAVVFGQLVGRQLEWRNLIVQHTEPSKISISDVLVNTMQDREHSDKVVKMSIGYSYLVVCTTTQVSAHDLETNATSVFDTLDTVALIKQAERVFMILDMHTGLQVFYYDGRQLSTLQCQHIRLEFLNPQSVSLSSDVAAVRDTFNSKQIQFFDVNTGRPAYDNIIHSLDIVEIALNPYGGIADRVVVFIDANKDLWIARVAPRGSATSVKGKQAVSEEDNREYAPVKLGSMCTSMRWNDYSETLMAIADSKLTAWYFPSVAFVDRDLLTMTKHVFHDTELSSNDQLLQFSGTRCSLRRGNDGAVLTFTTSPHPIMLFQHVANKQWGAAMRLCRFVKENSLWAILAAVCVKEGRLEAAMDAYAAIDEADKIQYLAYIKDQVLSIEGRNAELALLMRRPREAHRLLMAAGLVYRAIRMAISLYEWERALDVAVQHLPAHTDTVVAFRKAYLGKFDLEETSEKFLKFNTLEINEDVIGEKIEREMQIEANMQGAGPYKGDA